MKRASKFFYVCVILYSILLYARNPFEFADEQLKKYMPIKIEKEKAQEQQHQTWKIIETQGEATHIIEDHQGNIRAISFGSEN